MLFIVFVCLALPVMLVLSVLLEEQMLEPLEYFRTQELLHSDGYILMSLAELWTLHSHYRG